MKIKKAIVYVKYDTNYTLTSGSEEEVLVKRDDGYLVLGFQRLHGQFRPEMLVPDHQVELVRYEYDEGA